MIKTSLKLSVAVALALVVWGGYQFYAPQNVHAFSFGSTSPDEHTRLAPDNPQPATVQGCDSCTEISGIRSEVSTDALREVDEVWKPVPAWSSGAMEYHAGGPSAGPGEYDLSPVRETFMQAGGSRPLASGGALPLPFAYRISGSNPSSDLSPASLDDLVAAIGAGSTPVPGAPGGGADGSGGGSGGGSGSGSGGGTGGASGGGSGGGTGSGSGSASGDGTGSGTGGGSGGGTGSGSGGGTGSGAGGGSGGGTGGSSSGGNDPVVSDGSRSGGGGGGGGQEDNPNLTGLWPKVEPSTSPINVVTTPEAIPEPQTLFLMGAGILAMAAAARAGMGRRRRHR